MSFRPREIILHHSRQQVEGSFVNVSNHAVFTTRPPLNLGWTFWLNRAISALRLMSRTAVFFRSPIQFFGQTCDLAFVAFHAEIQGTDLRRPLAGPDFFTKAIFDCPLREQLFNASSVPGVSLSVAPFRELVCKTSSPPLRAAFISLLIAPQRVYERPAAPGGVAETWERSRSGRAQYYFSRSQRVPFRILPFH